LLLHDSLLRTFENWGNGPLVSFHHTPEHRRMKAPAERNTDRFY